MIDDTSCDCCVTVICTTYNQVNYIRKCLESLVSQVTSFRYRVIVHDDASDDGTSDIVAEFASRYPDRIVAIVQEKNLYSQGKSPKEHYRSLLSGRYVALCEGDDWWIDPNKLQKQFDYMELHPGCSLCSHKVVLYDDVAQKCVGTIPSIKSERDLSLDELIEGGGGYLGTNSFFYRTEHFDLPSEFSGWGVGDYPRMLYLATLGTVHCFSEIMSAYRVNAKGSWTLRVNGDVEMLRQTNKRIIEGLERANRFLNGRCSASFEAAVFELNRYTMEAQGDWAGLHSGETGKRFADLGFLDKAKSWLKCFLPKRVLKCAKIIHTHILFRQNGSQKGL